MATFNRFQQTAYTDQDRHRRITSVEAILGEYKRLKLPPVRIAGVLLSPKLVELMQDSEREEEEAMGD